MKKVFKGERVLYITQAFASDLVAFFFPLNLLPLGLVPSSCPSLLARMRIPEVKGTPASSAWKVHLCHRQVNDRM